MLTAGFSVLPGGEVSSYLIRGMLLILGGMLPETRGKSSKFGGIKYVIGGIYA